MKIGEFKKLSPGNQLKTVFKKGAYIADRCERDFTVVLYKLGRFCVEVFYHESDSEPVATKPFLSTDKLRPYFREVNLATVV